VSNRILHKTSTTHLVNAYEGKAGMVLFAGNTV